MSKFNRGTGKLNFNMKYDLSFAWASCKLIYIVYMYLNYA